MCEQKRRKDQEKEFGVQLGYLAYQRFCEITQNRNQPPTYAEFAKTQYYLAFIKFGRHIRMIKALKPERFIDWVIKNNKKLDHWCRDEIYEEYLRDTLKQENASDTLHRAFTEMVEWGEKQNVKWNDYFRYQNPNRICARVMDGTISPWILYNAGTAMDWLDKLDGERIGIIYPYIDPEYWQNKFENYIADTEFMRDTLKRAGL